MKKEFEDDHIVTVGIDIAMKDYKTKTDGETIELKVWDTAGQDRFRHMTYSFYKKADGIIISYDVTTR